VICIKGYPVSLDLFLIKRSEYKEEFFSKERFVRAIFKDHILDLIVRINEGGGVFRDKSLIVLPERKMRGNIFELLRKFKRWLIS